MNNSPKIFAVLLILVCCILSAITASGQDKTKIFHLKDQTTIRGTIVSETSESFVVATGYGTLTIRKSDIVRTEPGTMPATQTGEEERRLIQTKDGNEIRGIIIGEKGDSLLVETSYGTFTIPQSNIKRIVNLVSPEREREREAPSSPARFEAVKDAYHEWKIIAGVCFPSGDFGTTSPQNQAGYATTGFTLGMSYDGEITTGVEGILVEELTRNALDATEYQKLFPQGTQVDPGAWYSLWTMGGFGFGIPMQTEGRFHAGAFLGILVGISPSITATLSSSYYSSSASQSAAEGVAFAYGGYVGITVSRFAAEMHYMTGEPEYTINVTSGSGSGSGTFKQPTALFDITVGIVF